MEILHTQPRPRKLVLTNEEAKFFRDIYNLIVEVESATNDTVPREGILEDIIVACCERVDEEEEISIDLDVYYEE